MTDTQRHADMSGPTGADADVTELLTAQHRRIEALFAQLLGAPPAERDDVFCELRRLLAVHETAEELVVHPALRALGDEGARIAEARIAEESRAKHVLADLEKRGVDDADFLAIATELQAAVLAHAEQEEREELTRLRDHLSEDSRRTMAKAVRAAEAAAPTHPHPHGPDGALGNLVVGPFAAVADRVRDAVSHLAGR